jgi:hypothetical protein
MQFLKIEITMNGYVGMAHIKKQIKVKEKIMFVGGNGFRV